MKVITGYLLDRETGVGISGKTVSFEKLNGDPITTATTYAQSVSSTTDANGRFSGWFELSPGPVNVQVDVGASEVKRRVYDEQAKYDLSWSSDQERVVRALRDGVIKGFLNELAVTSAGGHNIS